MGAWESTRSVSHSDGVFFDERVLLTALCWRSRVPAGYPTAFYGQYISNGYSYLKRTDANAFLAGTYKLTLNGHDGQGQAISYTGSVKIGGALPAALPGKSIAGQSITGSTGAPATLSP